MKKPHPPKQRKEFLGVKCRNIIACHAGEGLVQGGCDTKSILSSN